MATLPWMWAVTGALLAIPAGGHPAGTLCAATLIGTAATAGTDGTLQLQWAQHYPRAIVPAGSVLVALHAGAGR